ncbi:hypothetical protein B0A48_01016 [Cryoendolithus antarcticus]|uniref:Uncharacterized protein n=1 Tax=Cryoendolithus antarcticus TaxID=1507870 RepID=A0A1V8TS13_9PEZI|nr:hypothetical protein B0A48_01016 [Cryoendolithus antarcticus]
MIRVTSARALGHYDTRTSTPSARSSFGGTVENVTAEYAFGEDDGTGQLGVYQPRIGLRQAGLKQPSPIQDSELKALASKGCNLLYMMAASKENALTRMQRNPKSQSLLSSESTWTNAVTLKDNGWRETNDKMENWAYAGINEVLKDLKVDPTDSTNNRNIQLVQDQPSKDFAISKGTYNQYINVNKGLVVPYYIYSPQHEAAKNSVKGKIVPLSRYSDVLFLEWKKLCGRSRASACPFQYFLFLNIENQPTWGTIMKVLKNKGVNTLQPWPGTTVDMDSDEGRALLATQIGNPLAWYLIQHKDDLGLQTVTKVNIFRNKGMTNQDTDHPYPNLLKEASQDKHCSPSDSCCCPTLKG